jgi:hypothetical protein
MFRPFRAWTVGALNTQGVALGYHMLPRWGLNVIASDERDLLGFALPGLGVWGTSKPRALPWAIAWHLFGASIGF